LVNIDDGLADDLDHIYAKTDWLKKYDNYMRFALKRCLTF